MPQVGGTRKIENARGMRKEIERREREGAGKETKIKERASFVREREARLEHGANRLSQQETQAAKGKPNVLDQMADAKKKQEELNEAAPAREVTIPSGENTSG